MKNKNNLIIFLPKFVFSGAGNSVYSFINFLNQNEYDIHVICLGTCDYKHLFNKSVSIYELNNNSLFSASLKIFLLVNEISKKSRKTIIHSNHHYANIYSILFKLILKKINVICVERTCIYELSKYFSSKDFLKKNVIKFFVFLFYRYADSVISNTIYTKKEILKFSRKNVFQVYPPSIKRILPFKKKINRKTINIIWVGNLVLEKGLEDLILSIPYINFKSNIFVLGDGKEYSKISKMFKYKNNKNVKVYFTKFIHDTSKYYRKSHILINTSFFEGSNNSIVEAINHNLVIIASRTPGGNTELVKKSGFGVLYEKNNFRDLAEKLNYIVLRFDKFQKKIKKKNFFLKKFINVKSNKSTLKILKKI